MQKINAGETQRVYCEDCSTEFEVCFEPKAKESPIEDSNIIEFCPFCGHSSITET